MATITDPDSLNQGVEVTITPGALTIQLAVAGNLSNDGASLQALYSFLKEEWKTDANLIRFPFPMVAITPEQFEFVQGWEPADATTRNLFRTGGWREISAASAVKREYAGIISLGNIDVADTGYFAFSSDTAKTDFDFTGVVNQGIQTFGDASNGSFDKRADALSLYVRAQGKAYGRSTTADIGVTGGLSYFVYRFPLAEATDLNINESDTNIDANAPYTGMSITYHATPQSVAMGASNYDFGVEIAANGATIAEVYEFVQRQLRLNSDIDDSAGDVNGLLADNLLEFVGEQLQTLSVANPNGGGTGVYISNFSGADTNSVQFSDNTGSDQTFPFVATGAIQFNSNLVGDTAAIYRMFFTTNPAGDYGTANAVLVKNLAGTDISGDVSGVGTIAFDFDYDGNVQGGRTSGTPAGVTIVAIGEQDAQYVVATASITRSTGQNIALTSPLERNFSNPA